MDDDRRRSLENLGALVAILAFLAIGYVVIDGLSRYNKEMACVESGHRSCATAHVP